MKLVPRDDARSQGLKRYFTGIACRNGHISERFVGGGHCLECCKITSLKLRAANPDRQKQYDSNYKLRSPEKYKAKSAKYREANREICRERVRLDHLKSKEKRAAYAKQRAIEYPDIVAEYSRKHYRNNKESRRQQAKDYRKKNPHKASVFYNNRREKSLTNGGQHTTGDISDILKMQKGRCAYCKEILKKKHVDHIIPLALGGTNDRKNLQVLCVSCNLSKSSRHPLKFARDIGLLL